tara:strand:- start:1786 stop:1953 length:168 start_codon:yes stop_codon:yes gene_type:complete
MSLFDLALTKGEGNIFDIDTLERLKKQEMEFNKPEIIAASSLIPLAIIAYLVFKK